MNNEITPGIRKNAQPKPKIAAVVKREKCVLCQIPNQPSKKSTVVGNGDNNNQTRGNGSKSSSRRNNG